MTISTKSGIYEIRNTVTGHCYIGSSINMRNRKYHHINALRRGEHHSNALQNAWRKYGEENFEFLLVEEVPDTSLLIQREQYWIDTRHPKYNMNIVAESRLGLKNAEETNHKIAQSHEGLRPTSETLKKMSLAKKDKKQSPEMIASRVEGMQGHEVSEATRLKIAASNRETWAKKTPEEKHAIATNRPPISDETRRKQSESHKDKPQSPDLVAKRIEASWGSKTDEEKAEIIAKRRATMEANRLAKQSL